jgi:hypothetical protein
MDTQLLSVKTCPEQSHKRLFARAWNPTIARVHGRPLRGEYKSKPLLFLLIWTRTTSGETICFKRCREMADDIQLYFILEVSRRDCNHCLQKNHKPNRSLKFYGARGFRDTRDLDISFPFSIFFNKNHELSVYAPRFAIGSV